MKGDTITFREGLGMFCAGALCMFLLTSLTGVNRQPAPETLRERRCIEYHSFALLIVNVYQLPHRSEMLADCRAHIAKTGNILMEAPE